MRIFLSYASEHRDTAESIAIRLGQDGHEVFFDRRTLRPGHEFDATIRERIGRCDLFVFLISPEALEAGAYTLTELELAQGRWPSPSRRLLPVVLRETPMGAMPAYVRAVTLFQPKGNLVAEVAAEVAEMTRERRRQRLRRLGGAAVMLLIAVGTGAWLLFAAGGRSDQTEDAGPCYLAARLVFPAGRPPGLTLRLSGGGMSKDFSVASSGAVNLDLAPGQLAGWELAAIDRDGTHLGRVALTGCPQSDTLRALNENIRLELRPR